jgi:hypothetical protein
MQKGAEVTLSPFFIKFCSTKSWHGANSTPNSGSAMPTASHQLPKLAPQEQPVKKHHAVATALSFVPIPLGEISVLLAAWLLILPL